MLKEAYQLTKRRYLQATTITNNGGTIGLKLGANEDDVAVHKLEISVRSEFELNMI